MTTAYNWTTPRGAKISATVTVEHITSEIISADGIPVEVSCNRWKRKIDSLMVNGNPTALREFDWYGGKNVIVIARRGKDRTMVAIPEAIENEIFGEERQDRAERMDRAIANEKAYRAHHDAVVAMMNN